VFLCASFFSRFSARRVNSTYDAAVHTRASRSRFRPRITKVYLPTKMTPSDGRPVRGARRPGHKWAARSLFLLAAAAALSLLPPPALATPQPGGCAASTGAELVAALGESGCATILLDGVVTLHDGDFPGNANAARTTNVSLTSAAGVAWATLETSSLLSRHVDVPPGVTVSLSNLYIAGASRLVEAHMAGERPFSAFSLADGAAALVTGCDVRLAPGSCAPTDAANLAWLKSVDPGAAATAAPAGSGARGGEAGGHGVAVSQAAVPVDVLRLAPPASAAAGAAAAQARPGAAVVILKDTTLWCSWAEAGVLGAAGDAGGAAARRAASRVIARVWTGPELASALGRTGSRTIVLSNDALALPEPVTDALDGPEALIQDREIILRGREHCHQAAKGADADAASTRVIIPLAPVPPGDAHPADMGRKCKQPFLRAGQGGSVVLADLTLAAVNPGCALMHPGPPAACSVNGSAAPLPDSLRGTLLPAGMVGAEPGGSLSLEGVAIEYEDCTPGLAAMAAAVVAQAGSPAKAAVVHVSADGVVGAGGAPPPPGTAPAGLVLSLTAATIACHRADIDLPMAVSLVNVTVACGSAARRVGGRGGGSRPVGLASGSSNARAAGQHKPAVVALAATAGAAACLALVAATAAGLAAASSRRAATRAAVAASAGASAVAAAPAAGAAGPSEDGDVDSARGGGRSAQRRARGWVAKLWGSDDGKPEASGGEEAA